MSAQTLYNHYYVCTDLCRSMQYVSTGLQLFMHWHIGDNEKSNNNLYKVAEAFEDRKLNTKQTQQKSQL